MAGGDSTWPGSVPVYLGLTGTTPTMQSADIHRAERDLCQMGIPNQAHPLGSIRNRMDIKLTECAQSGGRMYNGRVRPPSPGMHVTAKASRTPKPRARTLHHSSTRHTGNLDCP
jgi:hypothetical protein